MNATEHGYTVIHTTGGGLDFRTFSAFAEASAYARALAEDGDDAFVYTLQQEYFAEEAPPLRTDPARPGIDCPVTLARPAEVISWKRAV